jgi:hypothetical protein
MEIRGKHMAIGTANNIIKIWDISRRNVKQIGMGRKFENNGDSLGEIK